MTGVLSKQIHTFNMRGKYDATPVARQVVSAVYSLGEGVSINFLIDFLTGSHADSVTDEHRKLPGFGSGRKTGRQDWLNLTRELISRGCLKRGSPPDRVSITEKGSALLQGKELLLLQSSPFKRNEKVLALSIL